MTSGRATVTYCLVDDEQPPSLDDVPAGLPGAEPPRLVEVRRGRWLIVASAPLERYGEDAIRAGLTDLDWVSGCALAHEEVNEALLPRARSLLPMKLFTLFFDDESARRHVVERAREVDAVVERIAGCVEYGVRGVPRARPVSDHESARPANGRAFLARKRDEREAARTRTTRAREAAAGAFEQLGALARAHRRKELPADARAALLDGVLLIARAERDAFVAAVTRLDDALSPEGVGLTLTGPWPPYHFLEDA